ncbi:MAG: hypothetical protein K2H49_01815 [Muribaculaceae bacterium]|nr:hypothetical protein [Muribaculaceae bacterium]
MELCVQINDKYWLNLSREDYTSTKTDAGENRMPDFTYDNIRPTAGLVPTGTYPTGTIRIALEDGDADKVRLLLGGEISRVDAATAERITDAIVRKAAQLLLDITTDLRRRGLFIMPFRFYTMTEKPDGTLSYPSPQGVALPSDYPPHPEITAHQVTADSLTIALRFAVHPHRLKVAIPETFPAGHSLLTFISYPLYIPDPKEMRGSIGSVKSATGGNATGVRFSFLSTAAIKASVASPEKYHRLTGNERTGYHMASKAASDPDYTVYAKEFGICPIFPGDSMLAAGIDTEADTDPMDWIADWKECGEGYLPASLPHIYRNTETPDPGKPVFSFISTPFRLNDDSGKHCSSIRSIRLHGLPDLPCKVTLYGSMDRVHWQPLRLFDPRTDKTVMTPPRIWWRLQVTSQ